MNRFCLGLASIFFSAATLLAQPGIISPAPGSVIHVQDSFELEWGYDSTFMNASGGFILEFSPDSGENFYMGFCYYRFSDFEGKWIQSCNTVPWSHQSHKKMHFIMPDSITKDLRRISSITTQGVFRVYPYGHKGLAYYQNCCVTVMPPSSVARSLPRRSAGRSGTELMINVGRSAHSFTGGIYNLRGAKVSSDTRERVLIRVGQENRRVTN